MKVRELFAEFDAFNVDSRARKTVEFYRGRLKAFVAKFGDREFGELKPLEIQKFLRSTGKGVSPTTLRHNIVAFLRLQSFAVENKVIAAKIIDRIEKPPQGKRDRVLKPEEIAAIRNLAPPEFDLIFRGLLATGARPDELCRAQITDLKDNRKILELKVHKTARRTGKSRKIMVGKQVAEIFAAAIGDRADGPIFLSPRGNAWTPENLSGMFRRRRDKAKLSKELCLYLTRHTFGTNAVARVGLDVASRLLGHTQISTTQRYAHPDDDTLRKRQDDVLDDDAAAA